MLKRRILFSSLAAGLLLQSCQYWNADPVSKSEVELMFAKADDSRRGQLDSFNLAAMEFYEETADAYYILGYEYYRLAKIMQDQGKKEQSDNYFKLAMVYREQQRDLESLAGKRRDSLSPLAKAKLEPVMAPASQPAQSQVPAQGNVKQAATPIKATSYEKKKVE